MNILKELEMLNSYKINFIFLLPSSQQYHDLSHKKEILNITNAIYIYFYRVQILDVYTKHDSGSERRGSPSRTRLDREKRLRTGRPPRRANSHHGYRTGLSSC